MSQPASTAVVLFSRTPSSEGARKDFGLGGAGVGRLSRSLLRQTLGTVGALPDHVPVVLLTDGDLDTDDRRRLGPRPLVHLQQRGATFEERLLGGLRRVAARGYTRLVVIGSDTPSLQARDLRRALRAAGPEAVVGGSRDGGFYLLGLDAARLDRLRGLPWCTQRLFGALRARLAAAGLRLHALATRRDVDAAVDVRRLRHTLERLCRRLVGRGLGEGLRRLPRAVVRPLRLGCAPSSVAIRAPPAVPASA